MSYLLDTNVCILIMSGRDPKVRAAYHDALAAKQQIAISTVVLYELEYGIAKSLYQSGNRQRLADFLDDAVRVLGFEPEDARHAAELRASLQKLKQPIGPYDTLIAGQALARGLTLVTANVREFSRVKGLRWVDWAAR